MSAQEPIQSNTDTPSQDANEMDLPPPLRADSSLTAANAAFGEYMVRKGFSDNTIKAFRNDLKILLGYLGPETPLHQVSTRRLEEFLEWMQFGRGKPCSAKTLTRRITTLKVFFGWLHGIGILGTDPAEPSSSSPPAPAAHHPARRRGEPAGARCTGLSLGPAPP